MSLAIVYGRACAGVEAPLVSIEVHLSNGLPGLSIVGLPETAVRESKDRVRGALLNSRFEFPARRITINLAPADLPKEGGRFDLPIAIGILAASNQIPREPIQHYEFAGELALGGGLRAVGCVLPMAIQAHRSARGLIVPRENADEAVLVSGAQVIGAEHLLAVCGHLTGNQVLVPQSPVRINNENGESGPDLAEVRGQWHARRALEVAAAGGHSLLFSGPPGTGKSMLVDRLPGILPPMSEAEALETAAVVSVSRTGAIDPKRWKTRPVRKPHHTASAVALVGGGSIPRPGELSLAHNGILFLDELPEFERRALEVLREPLETGSVTISRAARHAEYPARIQLVAAMNPCQCGYLGDPSGRCSCTPEQIQRYRNRISGPLLDRIDMHVEVARLPHQELRSENGKGESSATVRQRVIAARERQLLRQGVINHGLSAKQIESLCILDEQGYTLLETAAEKLGLSARAYHRILKVARTIADLADCESITTKYLSEAIGYRRLDRKPPLLN